MRDKSKIVLGAQLFTLREVITDKASCEKCLKAVADMGYKTVQLSAVPVGFENPEWFRGLCDSLGLGIISTHNNFADMLTDEGLQRLIDTHKALGVTNMGIGFMPHVYHNKEGMYQFAALCNEIAKKVKAQGIDLLYHNHRFEFEKFDGVTGMQILLEKAPELMFLPDLYWVTAGGVNPIDFLEMFKGRYNHLHYKDYGIRNNEHFICEIGRGNINYAAITNYLMEQGIYDYVVEQDTCDGDPLVSLKQSIDYLQNELIPSL